MFFILPYIPSCKQPTIVMSEGASWAYATSVALTGWNPAFSMFIQLPILIVVTLIMLFYFELSFGKSLLSGYLVQIPITLFLAKVGFDFFLSYFGLSGTDAGVPEVTAATASDTSGTLSDVSEISAVEDKKTV